ncbi:ATPase [Salipaludibacillus agaradhaerens]|nr:ATPase [Salipaludibacillus agaradhaerens]
MMTLFTFKNIQMTERTGDTLLGVYIDEPSSDKYGTYDTTTKFMYEIMERIVPNFKNKDMQDVIDKIERSAPTVEQTKDRHLFVVNNGVYDQRTQELRDFSPDYVYLTKIPVDYTPNPINPVITAADGYQWDVESWIKDLAVDEDTETLIWQVIADCLQPHYSRHKSIWFYSEKGNNGKGTIGQLIKNLLGKGNYASLSVADFNHEFLKETLLGSAANISDENDVDVFIDSIKDYKASVTGDDININRKYEKPLRMQFLGTNIQMMNGLPKTKDKSESFYRRLIIVPFLKSFTNNGERKYIKTDYIHETEVLQYVLHKVLNMSFDDYITPKSSAELLESYKEKNNPVLEFWNEVKEDFVWDLVPTQFLYDLFVKWFDVNNPSGKVMSKRTFSDTLANVIHTLEDPWDMKLGQYDKVRSAGRMDDDEPLITEYGLDKPDKGGKYTCWVNPTYNGQNEQKKREFTRKKYYRGILRI